MRNIWFVSDTHFGHENILKFIGDDGNPIRPGFDNVRDMDDFMIDQWNSVIKSQDYVWHLGDFMLGQQQAAGEMCRTLNGHKRLVVGNHDNIKMVSPHFEKVELWRIWKEFNFTCTHFPIRPDQLRKTAFNVHGHIHQNIMQKDAMDDPMYINVCVEHWNYTPIHLDQILEIIKLRS